MAFAFAFSSLLGRPAVADPPADALLVDGLATLAGGRASDESDSIPVLLSDVELEAALILLRKGRGAQPEPAFGADTWIKARRQAVLVRMLSAAAKQLGESPDPLSVEALKKELTERAGGPEAMERMLAGFGAGAGDLDNWARNALLAAGQVKYMEEQVDIPSDREIVERMERDGNGRSEAENAYEAKRRLILEERLNLSMAEWLNDVLAKGRVRIMK